MASDGHEAITVRLGSQCSAALEGLAAETAREPAALVDKAIDADVATQRWQFDQIARGATQAKNNDFASETDVAAAYARRR